MSNANMDLVAETSDIAKWREFVSPGFGLVLSAPANFEDRSDERFFQVVDPDTGAEFTGAAYAGLASDLASWAEIRFDGVLTGLPFLREAAAPKAVQGGFGEGIVAEYEGQFVDENEPGRYLVLCFLSGSTAVSFTASVPLRAWNANEGLYRQLMTERLSCFTVRDTAAVGADLTALELAADKGDAQAQYVLATTLAQRVADGDAAASAVSFAWYRKAAEQGHAGAQVACGVCLANGWGCEADPVEGAQWWLKAADQGSPDAHFYLAVANSQGFGLEPNAAKALEHCRIAAEMGHSQAQEQLANLS
jgi:hypothetical protein